MNSKKKIGMLILTIAIIFLISCSKEEPTPVEPAPIEPPEILTNDYSGWLELHFTNQYPAFDETAQVDVTINKYGEVTFEPELYLIMVMTTTDNQE